MKKHLFIIICLLLSVFCVNAADKKFIKVTTDGVELVFQVGQNGRLYQSYLGKKLSYDTDLNYLPMGTEAYLTHGMEDYFEPAIHIVHNDFNSSLLLKYVSHSAHQLATGVDETVITLQDEKYPVTVKLHFIAYAKENLIKTFTEITHQEKKAVKLQKYASSMLHLNHSKYFLTEFAGDWAHEANMTEQPLSFGKKVIDTKLGSRADMFVSPFFLVALDKESEENNGEVLVGSLGWTFPIHF